MCYYHHHHCHCLQQSSHKSQNEQLIDHVCDCHSFSTFCAPTPLQHGCAAALQDALRGLSNPHFDFDGIAKLLERNWEVLRGALVKAFPGIEIPGCDGGYFLVADTKNLGLSDFEFCQLLAETKKIAAVPMRVFYDDPNIKRSLVRFCIAKTQATIDEASTRLST